MASTATLATHKNVFRSVSFTDIQRKFGAVVAERFRITVYFKKLCKILL